MDTSFEEKVRARAYEIWMSAGMADGMAHEHWMIAERAVANETGLPARVAAPAKPVKSKAPTATAVKPKAPVKTNAKVYAKTKTPAKPKH